MATHVLIVEDEARLARNVAKFLAHRGFVTTIASEIADALDTLVRETIDIVLLDIELPDGNGLDAFRDMRQRVPQLHGVVMSGIVSGPRRALAQGLGIQHFLVKPFSLQTLANTLDTLSVTAQEEMPLLQSSSIRAVV